MNKKSLLSLLLSSLFMIPITGSAVSTTLANSVTPQIRVQIGNTRRHRGWTRGRHLGWYRNNRHRDMDRDEDRYQERYRRTARNSYRRGYVQQVYYVNGRRYVRWIRNY